MMTARWGCWLIAERAQALRARLQGPGGWYNVGNVLGLATGLGVQVAASQPGEGGWATLDHLAGSGAALAMTGATLVFLLSGEAYHRAWGGPRPDRRLGQLGDLLSAVGAAGLALIAVALGQGVLAAAGALHAAGRLASAAALPPPPPWPRSWPDPYRAVVLASRLPAFGGAAWATWAEAAAGPERLIPPVLVVCTLMWMRADLMLAASVRAHEPRPGGPLTGHQCPQGAHGEARKVFSEDASC